MRKHSAERWEEARRLVVAEGKSYALASAATGISASTIGKKAAREEWQAERAGAMSYSAQIKAIKSEMAGRILDRLGDPELGVDGMKAVTQLIHAWRGAEAAFPEHRYVGEQGEDPRVRLAMAVAVLEDLVSYLTKHDRTALAALEPHLVGFAGQLERAA